MESIPISLQSGNLLPHLRVLCQEIGPRAHKLPLRGDLLAGPGYDIHVTPHSTVSAI